MIAKIDAVFECVACLRKTAWLWTSLNQAKTIYKHVMFPQTATLLAADMESANQRDTALLFLSYRSFLQSLLGAVCSAAACFVVL